jgi:hypothetical protein
MGGPSLSLNELRTILAPVMDKLVLNERLDDAAVGFIEKAPYLRNRKLLVRKQVADR